MTQTVTAPVKTISREDLYKMFLGIKSAKFATIKTLTDPKMRKTNNPYLGTMKETVMNITLNFNYENSVNSQRTKEGTENDFEALPRKWGQRVPNTCLVMHNGKIYIEVKANGKPQSTSFISPDGTTIEKSLLLPFLPVKKSNAEHQGVEKEIILRDYSLENITGIKIDGSEYIVK